MLAKKGPRSCELNPLQLASYRKSGIRKVKNDRTDAVWIDDFVHIAHLPPVSRDIPTLFSTARDQALSLLALGAGRRPQTQAAAILDRVFPLATYARIDATVQQSRLFQGSQMHMIKYLTGKKGGDGSVHKGVAC